VRRHQVNLTRRPSTATTRHPALALVCACVVLVAASAPGAAAPRKTPRARVLIVTLGMCCPSEAWGTAERRIIAELRTLGLIVRSTPSAIFGDEGPARRKELDELGRRRGASVVILIHRASRTRRTTVWIWQARTTRGGHNVRTLVIGGRAARSPTLLALQLAEQVRSRPLVAAPPPKRRERELWRHPPPKRRLPALPFRRPAPSTPRQRQNTGPWSIRLGVGVKADSDRKHSHIHGRLTLSWYPLPYLATDLSVAASFAGDYQDMRVEDSYHSFYLGFVETLFWMRWEILSRGRLRPSVGAGIGPKYIYSVETLSGNANSTWLSYWVADVAFTAQLAVGLSRRIWLRISFEITTSWPTESPGAGDPVNPTPLHPNPAVASFGNPWMWGVAVAFEARLP